MNSILGRARLAVVAVSGLALVACDSIRNVDDDDFSQLPTPNVVLRGAVTGLTTSPVVLTAHYVAGNDYVGSEPEGSIVREVTKDGPVSFAAIPRNAQYTVAVTGLPIGKLCNVTNGTGTAQGNVTNVAVACAADPNAPTYTVSGSVVGLAANAAGLQLTLSSPAGEETVDVAAGGDSFAFTSELLTDFDYEVTIETAPSVPGAGGAPATVHNCALGNASGTIVSTDVTDVEVRCGFEVGGTLNLLAGALGAGLQLQLAPPGGAPETLSLAAAGDFAFDSLLPSHASANYAVSIAQQPAGQTCILRNAGAVPMTTIPLAGEASGAVDLYCKDNPGGAFSGTALTGTYQLGAEREFVSFFANGTFLLGSNNATASQRGVEHGFYYYGAFGPGTLWFLVVTDTNSAGNGLSQYPTTDFFGTAYVPVSAIVTGAGQLTGTVSAGTPGEAAFSLTAVGSTPGQLHGAWAAANGTRVIVYNTTNNTGFQAAVNGAVNMQDLCITLGAPQGGGATGSYTASTDPATCTGIPGGLAPANTDATGQFAMPGTFFGPIDYTVTAGAPDTISLQPYFFGGPFGAPVVLSRSESNL